MKTLVQPSEPPCAFVNALQVRGCCFAILDSSLQQQVDSEVKQFG